MLYHAPGVVDSNNYSVNDGNTLGFYQFLKVSRPDSLSYHTRLQWIARTSLDSNSTGSFKSLTALDSIVCFIDTTAATPDTIPLVNGTWCDVYGDTVTSPLILQPFTSRILIRDSTGKLIDYNPATRNGGLETGDLTDWAQEQATVTVDASEHHTGSYSLKLVSTGGVGGWASNAAIGAGANYTLKFWAKSSNIWVYAYIGDGGWQAVEISGTWTEYTITGASGAGTAIGFLPTGAGTVYIDDVQCYLTP